MRAWQAIAVVIGVAGVMSGAGVVYAQDKPPTPPAPVPASASAALNEPPCKAVALSQQDEILRLNDFITQLQQQIVRLQRTLLEQAKRTAEPDIVKEAGGTTGQGWDFERNTLRPAAPPPPAPPKP
jgi:hypothetical protein